MTARGEVATPAFMPVATRGMMRGVPHDRLRPMGVEMMLSNAFHLFVRPGVETVAKLGGVHGMLAWDGPVLTDSGGFQVFSLSELCRLHEGGVQVENPVYGGWIDWTPRLAFEVQAGLGPDVAMVLDHCPAQPLVREEVAPAVARTLRWAREQRELHDARGGAASGQAQFGIVQGGVFPELRGSCAEALVAMDFDGYAVGGVSVGEDHAALMRAVEASTAPLPVEKVRYLMGVGAPLDLVEAVARGIDLFDCVYPTRSGRFGTALTWTGRRHLLNARYRDDPRPIDPDCGCDACRSGVPRGALRAGLKAKELSPPVLLATHNLHFTQELMRRIRESIADATFPALRAQIRQVYLGSDIS
ncbi:MAG: tRNA guanosine(34) transglycosylase Tgt [Planctomycetes bacterium]|nr:tRNA guanosine(34) transglycosylase Tgt [Planctomycetota bacterium]